MREESPQQIKEVAESEFRGHSADVSPVIYIVDRDEVHRLRLAAQLRAAGYRVETYEYAEAFLEGVDRQRPGCLLLETRLAGMTGPELQRAVRRLDLPIGIIFMAEQADVRLAVSVVRAGAVDFIEKPVVLSALLSGIRAALGDARRQWHFQAEVAEVLARFETLTAREKEVMRLMTEGCPTKIAARQLGLSPRTIESHRTRVMEKMAARTLSTLVRQSIALERARDRLESR